MAKNMKVIVKPGRTVRHGVREGDERKVASYGPGKEITLETERAERLIARGFVVRAGTEEAATAKRLADTIPDNFPGRADLTKAGIETLSAVPRDRDALIALEGIGEKTADAILKALPEEE